MVEHNPVMSYIMTGIWHERNMTSILRVIFNNASD